MSLPMITQSSASILKHKSGIVNIQDRCYREGVNLGIEGDGDR
jgi:hypothetical protein